MNHKDKAKFRYEVVMSVMGGVVGVILLFSFIVPVFISLGVISEEVTYGYVVGVLVTMFLLFLFLAVYVVVYGKDLEEENL